MTSRKLTEDEQYLVKHAQREPIEAAARLQETAKLLAAVVAGATGLLAVALVVISALRPLPTSAVLAAATTQALWAASLCCLLGVLVARVYRIEFNSPEGLLRTFHRTSRQSMHLLVAALALFALGAMAVAIIFGSVCTTISTSV